MAPEERFTHLSPTVKAFLQTLSDQEVVDLKNLLRFYAGLVERPHILKWLQEAREDEIELLDDGIKLLRAGNTVARFVWWALATLVGAAILGSQVGEWFQKLIALVSPGPK